jgi:hypothetical protein
MPVITQSGVSMLGSPIPNLSVWGIGMQGNSLTINIGPGKPNGPLTLDEKFGIGRAVANRFGAGAQVLLRSVSLRLSFRVTRTRTGFLGFFGNRHRFGTQAFRGFWARRDMRRYFRNFFQQTTLAGQQFGSLSVN